ncbi:hypothetical protein [Kitasatospora sp. NPDC018619]|uniref:hypothetical protein n=1 Tax=unclassified Kitasatospora TaxID=2633591 RepID=UPI0037A3C5FF
MSEATNGTVSGATSDATGSAVNAYALPGPDGRFDCPSALRAVARGGHVRQRVFFADEATALAAGYRPCAACGKDRYQRWRTARENGRS